MRKVAWNKLKHFLFRFRKVKNDVENEEAGFSVSLLFTKSSSTGTSISLPGFFVFRLSVSCVAFVCMHRWVPLGKNSEASTGTEYDAVM